MTVKATFFFTQNRYSWSESHYLTSTSIPAAAESAALTYSTLRTRILGDYARMTGIRISHVDPATRQVFDVDPALFSVFPVWPPDVPQGTYSSDIATTSVLTRMVGASGGSKNWYIAGCPDVTVETGPNATGNLVQGAPPGWIGYFNTFMVNLYAVWSYRSIQNEFPSQAISAPVTNALYPQTVGIVTAGSLGVNAGQHVYLTRWVRINPKSKGLSGYYRVAAVLAPVAPATTPYTYFLASTGNVNPLNFTAPGQISVVSYTYPTYVDFNIQRAVSHKRGGSYGQPRGRSRIGA